MVAGKVLREEQRGRTKRELKSDPQFEALAKAINGVRQDINEWLDEQGRTGYRPDYSLNDCLRLYRLYVWGSRYKLAVAEILDVLVPALKSVVKRKAKAHGGLEIPAAVLTGRAARGILLDTLLKRYPNRENITAFKERERERQLLVEKQDELGGITVHVKPVVSFLEAESVEDFLQKYRERIEKKREENVRAALQSWRRRKNYRGNPWR